MKKIVLFLLLGMFSSGAACAEELIVTLNSGNTVVVQYTGTIQGVTLKGTTDGIAGISMPHSANPAGAVNPQGSGKEQTAMPQDEKKEVKNQEKGGIRFKWAEPIRED
ncbi:MAG: hypothetical protein NTY00_07045 [Deltaproteobacteria bacterium]|nr:hypothetical protein [Deltaproteobacteria bacterium]